MIRLAQALLLDGWSGVRLLAGPDDAGHAALAGVSVLAGVRDQPPGSAADRVVVVPVAVDRDDWLLDVLLRRCAAVRAAALLVGGDAPLGRASAQVARRLAVPVLGADDPMQAAVTLRVHLELPELAAARWVTAVADAGAGSTTVDEAVTAAAEALDRPIGLLDSAGNLVAGTVSGGTVSGGTASGGTASEGSAGERDDPTGGPPDAVARWLHGPVDPRATWVHLAVRTDHPRGAYLVLRRHEHDPLRAVLAALQVLAGVVAGRLAVQRLDAERDARQRMSLMSQLLQSGGQLAADAPRRMLAQGWQLDGHHVGIRIDVPSAMDPVALRPEVLTAFAEAGVAAHVVEQGAGWLAWSTFVDPPTTARLQAHATSVRRVQWLLRSHLPSVMGVGSLQSGPPGLVRSLGEAGDAARIAATRTAGGHLVQVDRLGLGQLLLAWTRTDTFAPAASSLLTPLQAHPGLLETLAAYLEAESSVADTAAVLGVHRNTVTSRIARAVELLGVDLADPDERLAVQLACRSVLSHR